jgi:tetratricopeptide (TPR) repeat protein
VLALMAAGAAAPGAQAQDRPGHNRSTRAAERAIGLAMLEADSAQRARHYRDALASALEAVQEDASNPTAWLMAGRAYAGLDDFAGADSAFRYAERLHAPYANELESDREAAWARAYNLAAELYQAGRLQESIAMFEQADRLSRKWPYALVVLGWMYTSQGETDRAIDAYRAALDVFLAGAPEDAGEEQRAEWQTRQSEALQELGRLLTAAGRQAEAEPIYRAFLEQQPGHLPAMIGLAQAVGGEEADRLYGEILGREDLGEEHLFQIGAGLYEAGRYDGAAEAFRRAVALNDASRDAHFNLAQALYRQAQELQADSAGGAQAERRAKLQPILDELLRAADRTREFDPNNRDLLRMAAYAYRSLGELSGDQAEKRRFESELTRVAQEYEAIPFEVYDVGLAREGDGIRMGGMLENLTLEEGKSIRLRLSILGEGGAVEVAEDVEVRAPAAGETVEFSAYLAMPGAIRGWKYEVVE